MNSIMTIQIREHIDDLRAEWRAARRTMLDLNDDGDTAQSQVYARRADAIMAEIKSLNSDAVVPS